MPKKKTVRLVTDDNSPHAVVLRHPDGYPVSVRRGQEFDADDPLVKAHPDRFKTDSERDAQVEEATAAPGEKRNVKK